MLQLLHGPSKEAHGRVIKRAEMNLEINAKIIYPRVVNQPPSDQIKFTCIPLDWKYLNYYLFIYLFSTVFTDVK